MEVRRVCLLLSLVTMSLSAQEPQSPEALLLKSILQRMETLEQENSQMAEELHQLRHQLEALRQPSVSAAATNLEDRVAVTENRIEEQAQTKVEAAQKFPISFTGELLFNAFASTGPAGSLPDSSYSPFINAANSDGATVRQSMLGFNFRGPGLPGDGRVNAHIMLDFYSGTPSEQLDWLRIRTSDVSFDWDKRSITFALDKPLISPRQPDSLAEVAIPPLSNAGNLWVWTPQLRYEELFKPMTNTIIHAQAALMETDETYSYTPAQYTSSTAKTRPAVEGRLAITRKSSDRRLLELGAGFHESTSHVAGTSVASRIYSVDWLASPFAKLEITGTFFHGQNFAVLGALPDGYSIYDSVVTPVHGDGGWTQFSSPLTSRLTLNLFAGLQTNRSGDLQSGAIVENLSYAGNLMYHLTPNVIVSFESLQMRSRLKQNGDVIRNRYDLALAYLF